MRDISRSRDEGGGHASQAAMAIYQHATLDRDRRLAEQIGDTYTAWARDRLH